MAVMLCVPVASWEVLKEAVPPTRTTVESVVEPSVKVTLPVGTYEAADWAVTTAVNDTN